MKSLIVDDDFVSRMKLKALLDQYGQCDTVPNGETAIKLFRKAYSDKYPYDLITMDVNMPRMKGQEVVKTIRNWESKKNVSISQSVKILMITVQDEIKERMSSLFAGCELFLPKPVTPENLMNALMELGLSLEN